jgi:hypothetical protein
VAQQLPHLVLIRQRRRLAGRAGADRAPLATGLPTNSPTAAPSTDKRCVGAALASGRAQIEVAHQLLHLVLIRQRRRPAGHAGADHAPLVISPPVNSPNASMSSAGQDADRGGAPATANGSDPAAAARCAAAIDQLAVVAPVVRR